MEKKIIISSALVSGLIILLLASAMAQKKPKMTTLSGTVIDLTCASKGKVMMDNWHNAKNDDHMTPNGENEACAVMCLKGGQPAALFSGDKISAVFACNPSQTLANYAARQVDVQGFWAGDGSQVKTFVPSKIRARGAGSWEDVNCATMHN